MPRAASVLLAVGLLLLPGCRSPSESPAGELAVTKRAHSLRLTNRTDEPVYWFAGEVSLLRRLDWITCSDPSVCESIEPGRTRVLAYDEILGDSADARTVVVFWWHLVPKEGGGFRPDGLHSVPVEL